MGFRISDASSSYGNITNKVPVVEVTKKDSVQNVDYGFGHDDEFVEDEEKEDTKPKEIVITDNELLKYICEKTDMYFLSSTGGDDSKPIRDNQLVLNLDCNSFLYNNQSDNDGLIVHYSFGDKITPRDDVGDKIKTSVNKLDDSSELVIMKTEQQKLYFDFLMHKDLEFLQVDRNAMYTHQWIVNQSWPINITDYKTYSEFLDSNVTNKLYDTYSIIVSESHILPLTMAANPVVKKFTQLAEVRKILGVTVQYADIVIKELDVRPEYEMKLSNLLPISNDNYTSKQDWFGTQINLKATFVEKQYSWNYFGFNDIIGFIGGIGKTLASMMQSMGIFFVMFYIFELTGVIRRKYKKQQHSLKLAQLHRKLPMIEQAIHQQKSLSGEDLKLVEHLKKTKPEFLPTSDPDLDDIMKRIDQIRTLRDKYVPNQDVSKEGGQKDSQYSDDDEDETAQKSAFEWKSAVYKVMQERHKMEFHEIAESIKSRVSFYSIFDIGDQVELITREFYYLRQQLEDKLNASRKNEQEAESLSKNIDEAMTCQCECAKNQGDEMTFENQQINQSSQSPPPQLAPNAAQQFSLIKNEIGNLKNIIKNLHIFDESSQDSKREELNSKDKLE